jgi:hypothetical protein
VLVENKQVDCVRSNLHSAIKIPSHNLSFNLTNCRPVVKDFTLKESISHGVLLLDFLRQTHLEVLALTRIRVSKGNTGNLRKFGISEGISVSSSMPSFESNTSAP